MLTTSPSGESPKLFPLSPSVARLNSLHHRSVFICVTSAQCAEMTYWDRPNPSPTPPLPLQKYFPYFFLFFHGNSVIQGPQVCFHSVIRTFQHPGIAFSSSYLFLHFFCHKNSAQALITVTLNLNHFRLFSMKHWLSSTLNVQPISGDYMCQVLSELSPQLNSLEIITGLYKQMQ